MSKIFSLKISEQWQKSVVDESSGGKAYQAKSNPNCVQDRGVSSVDKNKLRVDLFYVRPVSVEVSYIYAFNGLPQSCKITLRGHISYSAIHGLLLLYQNCCIFAVTYHNLI